MTKLIVTVESDGTVRFNSPDPTSELIDICASIGALLAAAEEYIDGLTDGLTDEQRAAARSIIGSGKIINEVPAEKPN